MNDASTIDALQAELAERDQIAQRLRERAECAEAREARLTARVRELEAEVTSRRASSLDQVGLLNAVDSTVVAAQRATELFRANEALKYQAHLLDNVGDAVIAADADFRITFWNRAAETLYGWKAGEVLGKRWTEILPTEFAQTNQNEVQARLRAGDSVWAEGIVQRRDGASVRVEGSVKPLWARIERVAGYVSVSRDISRRWEAEQRLQETMQALQVSEEKFRGIFEQSLDGIIIMDERLRIIEWNARMEQIAGLSRGETVGKPAWDVFASVIPDEMRTSEALSRLSSACVAMHNVEAGPCPAGLWKASSSGRTARAGSSRRSSFRSG